MNVWRFPDIGVAYKSRPDVELSFTDMTEEAHKKYDCQDWVMTIYYEDGSSYTTCGDDVLAGYQDEIKYISELYHKSRVAVRATVMERN